MDGLTWLRGLEGGSREHREVDWLDVLVYAQEEHGRGAARWLAEQMDVTPRTAERYLAITTPGVKESFEPRYGAQRAAADRLRAEIQAEWDEADAADRRQQVADLLRLITSVAPGTVWVRAKSTPTVRDTRRAVRGELDVDLSAVADAWEDEDEDLAARELSEAILNAYGDRGGVEGLGDHIRAVDYEDGIDWH